ncbi:hypothetical protein [Polaribacter sp.]|uniref:hypothetical protein n=1 Tax=Polaribacter sp. TaxID=1920175 RepID=UPI0025DA5C52|nr:hypothetical protein [Polaribacter sp.]
MIEDLWFTSQLDKNPNVKYLINTTQKSHFARRNDFYNQHLVDFFKDELSQEIYDKSNYKDSLGRMIVPYILDYNLPKEYKALFQQKTDLDYVVLTKILSANEINNSNLGQYRHLKYRSNFLAGSVVFFKIIDVKNNTTALEISCKSAVYDDLDFNFETNSFEDDVRIATHQSEKQLIKKCFKSILRRIK